MPASFPQLSSPLTIGKLTIENRFAVTPMGPGFDVAPDGSFTQMGIDYYVRRAQGGFGLIYTGGMGIDTVVLALGFRPAQSRAAEFATPGVDVYEVGDGRQVGNIMTAIWEAYEVARGCNAMERRTFIAGATALAAAMAGCAAEDEDILTGVDNVATTESVGTDETQEEPTMSRIRLDNSTPLSILPLLYPNRRWCPGA